MEKELQERMLQISFDHPNWKLEKLPCGCIRISDMDTNLSWTDDKLCWGRRKRKKKTN